MKPVYSLQPGNTPLLVNVPHAGTYVPEHISEGFTAVASDLPDTDWFVDQLYAWVVDLGAGLMAATHSRYVIDLNRPPDDVALYQTAGTNLVPETTFSGQPVYQPEVTLDADTIGQRRQKYWQPYHDKLLLELTRIKQQHGFAILIDAHSILSHVPRLFDGQLPDLNLGSIRGQSADQNMISMSTQLLSASREFSFVLDGRFQGGYITRHYGQPRHGIHALQMEMAQCTYMQEKPPELDAGRVAKVRPVLESWLSNVLKWTPEQ